MVCVNSPENDTQTQYINAGLLLYQAILLCNTICLQFDEYFDLNSTPVCLLELFHLSVYTGVLSLTCAMSLLLDDWRTIYTENDHK